MTEILDSKAIVLIKRSEIIKIVRCALSKIDPRLIDHGERVGYIAESIRRELDNAVEIDPSILFILSVLHDIGAYKTNEIDDMIKFETDAAFDHALYGYLFLKNTTHLADHADALLYHHTDYSSPRMKDCHSKEYAQLIHLADRADILINTETADLSPLRRMAGTKFNPSFTDALFKADEHQQLSKKVKNNEYIETVTQITESLDIKNSEIIEYLKLLVYAIDFRSPYTVTHTADTTIISLETGRLLRLSEHDLQALYIGTFLHDIGKIAIPQTILEKPGKLTKEEFDIIKQHIPEGEQILRGVVNDEICDIALRHHEKLNGSGYSRGLSALQLTRPQRIVAVADIMSALSQRRSYKEAFPKEQVVAILSEMRDKGELCETVVNIVINNYDMILTNTERSHDPIKTLYSDLRQEYKELYTLMYPGAKHS